MSRDLQVVELDSKLHLRYMQAIPKFGLQSRVKRNYSRIASNSSLGGLRKNCDNTLRKTLTQMVLKSLPQKQCLAKEPTGEIPVADPVLGSSKTTLVGDSGRITSHSEIDPATGLRSVSGLHPLRSS